MPVFMSRAERESLPEWMYGSPQDKLFPVTSQQEIYRAPARIAMLPPARRDLVRLRMIRAAVRQGFKLPKSFQEEFDKMSTNTVQMTNRERDALKSIAALIEENSPAIFGEERRDESGELADVRRMAEEYADSLSGKSRVPVKGEGHADVRRDAERFADEFNRKHGPRR
jgi:hypothetical protein